MTRIQKGTLAATGIGLFMVFLDALIVNVALPDIQEAFHTDEAGLQWMVTAYSLAMAVTMMTWAALADRWGRRRIYLAGLVVFTLASVACGLAPSIGVMNMSRAIQGAAAAAVNVTSLALVSAAFDDEKAKGRAIGIWSAIAATGVALGPTLGGIITDTVGWRGVFFVNLAFGVVAVVLTVRFVGESRNPSERSLDVPGQVLFVAAVGGFSWAVIEGPQLGWASPSVLGAVAMMVVGLGLFVARELRVREPLMELRLFLDRTYTLAIVTVFAVLFAMYGMLLVINQLWQDVDGYSVLTTGFMLLPLALLQVGFAPFVGRWISKVGARRLMLIGLSLFTVAFTLQLVGIAVHDGLTVLGVALAGAGLAFTLTPATTVAMSVVEPDRAGMASGIMSVQRALGSTAGYAVFGSILAAWLGATLATSLATAVPDEAERDQVATSIIEQVNPRANVSEMLPAGTTPSATTATDDEISEAAEDDFRKGIALAIAVGAVTMLVVLIVDWRGIPPDRSPSLDEPDDADDNWGRDPPEGSPVDYSPA
jgi:EmrB/QacA subfamily drug resistance transporter